MIIKSSRTKRAISMFGDNKFLPLNFLHFAIFVANIIFSGMNKHD